MAPTSIRPGSDRHPGANTLPKRNRQNDDSVPISRVIFLQRVVRAALSMAIKGRERNSVRAGQAASSPRSRDETPSFDLLLHCPKRHLPSKTRRD